MSTKKIDPISQLYKRINALEVKVQNLENLILHLSSTVNVTYEMCLSHEATTRSNFERVEQDFVQTERAQKWLCNSVGMHSIYIATVYDKVEKLCLPLPHVVVHREEPLRTLAPQPISQPQLPTTIDMYY